ncbi:head GIN domain-containing protein [Pedobacter aquatilis]|uniref:head GIN domain-containing protein n=1 Tax=Pedobacter aquatilis TaxID=351343 RepID=UPI00292ECE5C|nr:head GIN domain-containing protein [Pedobacter aquatilis]
MKKIFSILFVAVLFTTSFSAIANFPVTTSTSKLSGDERDVKNFSGVAAGGPINVVITLGSTESCRFEGDEDAISTLITEVKGNVLIIRPQNSWTSWEHKYENKKITAYVTAKTITSLTMSGSGNMSVKGNVNSKTLSATLSGSGSITTSANVDDFNGVISGSGKLNINGSADDAKVVISGSGNFSGKGLSVNNLSTTVSGSGTIDIKAEQTIRAVISGSGNVNYTGNATVEKTVIGSGRVRKI